MRILVIISIFSALLFGACSNKEESPTKNLYLETLEKLEKDQKAVISDLMRRIKDKKKDQQTSERTRYWSPVFDSIVQYMSTMNTWFERLEDKLENSNDYKLDENEVGFIVDKIENHQSDFVKILGLISLKDDYSKKNVQELEKVIQSSFLRSFQLDSIQQFNKRKYILEKIYSVLQKSDLGDSRLTVKCLKTEFNYTVAQILHYIDIHTEVLITTYDFVRCIVASNSTALRLGEELEIVAGIGEFSNAAKPRFFVSGIEINAQQDEPILLYKKKINESPGFHSIPIIIEYFKPDGTAERIKKVVKYQVLSKN